MKQVLVPALEPLGTLAWTSSPVHELGGDSKKSNRQHHLVTLLRIRIALFGPA